MATQYTNRLVQLTTLDHDRLELRWPIMVTVKEWTFNDDVHHWEMEWDEADIRVYLGYEIRFITELYELLRKRIIAVYYVGSYDGIAYSNYTRQIVRENVVEKAPLQ